MNNKEERVLEVFYKDQKIINIDIITNKNIKNGEDYYFLCTATQLKKLIKDTNKEGIWTIVENERAIYFSIKSLHNTRVLSITINKTIGGYWNFNYLLSKFTSSFTKSDFSTYHVLNITKELTSTSEELSDDYKIHITEPITIEKVNIIKIL